jgi:3-oxoadipate enol-lactonase
MPTTNRDGVRLHWQIEKDGNGLPLLLLNSIGTDLHLWDAVVPHLAGRAVLRMDTRGHGRSDAPAGDYSLGMLADDVMAVLESSGIDQVAIAGVSLGGMIAMQVALDHPECVGALVPVCTSASMDRAAWIARVDMVRSGGTAAIVDLAMGRFLSPDFIEAHPAVAAKIASGLHDMADDGYAGCAAAIRDMDLLRRLPDLEMPTLVIAGDRDASTPFDGHGSRIAQAIAGSRTVHLEAAHLAPVEAPVSLASAISTFLETADGRG